MATDPKQQQRAERAIINNTSPTPILVVTYKDGTVFEGFPISVTGNGAVVMSSRGGEPDRPLVWGRVARLELDLGKTNETIDLDPQAVAALGLDPPTS